MNYARIEILTDDLFGNQKGDIIKVEHETDTDIYYTCGFGHWSSLSKKEENITYRYISIGERANYGKGRYTR